MSSLAVKLIETSPAEETVELLAPQEPPTLISPGSLTFRVNAGVASAVRAGTPETRVIVGAVRSTVNVETRSSVVFDAPSAMNNAQSA